MGVVPGRYFPFVPLRRNLTSTDSKWWGVRAAEHSSFTAAATENTRFPDTTAKYYKAAASPLSSNDSSNRSTGDKETICSHVKNDLTKTGLKENRKSFLICWLIPYASF